MATDRMTINRAITDYVAANFLDGADGVDLGQETPLLEWGILNSMNTATLMAYIRRELGVAIPPTHLTGRHFKNLRTITDMVVSLTA